MPILNRRSTGLLIMKWRHLGLAVLVLLVAAVAVMAGLLYLPQLEEQRRGVVEGLLERVIGRSVVVSGPIDIRPGHVSTVTIADASLGEGGPDGWQGTLTLKRLSITFDVLRAILGPFRVQRLEGDGLEIVVSGGTPAAEDSPLRLSPIIGPLARLMNAGRTGEIALTDLSFERRDDPDGWNGKLTFTEMTAAESGDAEAWKLAADGALDGSALKMSADFSAVQPHPDFGQARAFTVEASLPGVDERLEGFLEANGDKIDATLTTTLSSLGDLLDALKLKRQMEATGKASMQLSGKVDALTAAKVSGELIVSTGERVTVEGRIADLSLQKGIELVLQADLRRSDGSAPKPVEALDLLIESVKGQFSGALRQLTVSNLVLSTNVTSADIQKIGPISVKSLTRDDQGRLGLSGVHVLAGDPSAPSLDLNGSVADILAQTGIAFSGSFNLDVVALATGQPTPPGIGHLAGTITVADTDGKTRIESLSAALEPADIVALELDLPNAAKGEQQKPATIDLGVPDLDALAKVLGGSSVGGGSASFTGEVELVDALTISGRGSVDQTAIWLDLSQDVVGDRPVFKGRVKFPRLQPAGLQSLGKLASLVPDSPEGDEAQPAATTGPNLDAELEVTAALLDSDAAAQGSFEGKLVYRDNKATIDPLALTYLGGKLDAKLTAETGGDAMPVTLKGTIEQLELAKLIAELGGQPMVQAPLGATFELAATGADLDALGKTLDGNVAVTVGSGTVGTRLIDLTGENIVSWLFSSGSSASLVCADGQITFASGLGTIQRLILETDNVQLRGTGTIDLARDRLNLTFTPRPLREQLLQVVTPFRVRGPIDAPSVAVAGGTGSIAGRAVAETLTLPLNVLRALLDRRGSNRVPCAADP
jgi:uncharacterized protein involved in outer membrane biogenesis